MSRRMHCTIHGCKDPVFLYKRRLCHRHYYRAIERIRNSHGALTWEILMSNPQLLNGQRVGLASTLLLTDRSNPPRDARSCFGCSHLDLLPPVASISCAKNQWGHIRYLSISSVENSGLPPQISGRAQTCPFYRSKPRPSSTSQ